MAVRDIFKFSWRTFFNPAGWLDFEAIRNQTVTIYRIIKTSLRPDTPARTETFAEAMQRLHLTEPDLQVIVNRYRLYTWIFILCGLLTFAYSFYLLFKHYALLGCLLGLAVTALFFAQAFRYDFWVYQIKRRKLGATFDEWFRSVTGDKGGSA